MTEKLIAEIESTYTGIIYHPSDKSRSNPQLATITRYTTGSLPGGPQFLPVDLLAERRREWVVYLDTCYEPNNELYTEDLILYTGVGVEI